MKIENCVPLREVSLFVIFDALRPSKQLWLCRDVTSNFVGLLSDIENIQKKEDGPDRSVSNNKLSLVTLNGLAMKAGVYKL